MKWRTFYDGFRAMGNPRWRSALRMLMLAGMEPIDRVYLAASYVARYQMDDAWPCVVLESERVEALEDMRRLIDDELKACGDSLLRSIKETARSWRRKPRFDWPNRQAAKAEPNMIPTRRIVSFDEKV